MKLVIPFGIQAGTYASVTATDLVESISAWVSGASYSVGDYVSYTYRIYKCTTAVTSTTAPDADRVHWLDVRAANKWALFDYENSTYSSEYPSFYVDVTVDDLSALSGPPVSIDAVTVCAFGVVAGNLSVTSYESDGTTARPTTSISIARYTTDEAGSAVIPDIPLNSGFSTKIRHVFSGSYGASSVYAQCASLIVGQSIDCGTTQYSPTINLISYSRKETDEFGVTTFVKRANSKRVTVKTMIDNANMDSVWRAVSMLDGIPCVVIVSDITDLKPLNAFGFIKDFSIDVAYVNQSLCSIEFESLV